MPGWQIPQDYYSILAQIESSGNPNAKAKTSSASGLYQFTRDTWERLGYAWNNVFDVGQQNEAIRRFTDQNARALDRAGVEISRGSLYASHFLGSGGALKVFASPNETDLESVVGSRVINANPFLKGMSVGDFKNWLDEKTGGVSSLASRFATNLAASGGNPFAAAGITWGQKQAEEGDGIIGWLKGFFSVNTAARAIAVIVGVALIIVAITVLASNNETVQTVVKKVAK